MLWTQSGRLTMHCAGLPVLRAKDATLSHSQLSICQSLCNMITVSGQMQISAKDTQEAS